MIITSQCSGLLNSAPSALGHNRSQSEDGTNEIKEFRGIKEFGILARVKLNAGFMESQFGWGKLVSSQMTGSVGFGP